MTTQHTPSPWFIWKERAMQDEGDFDAEEIFEELSEDDKFYVMAGEPIGKVTRSSIRGCKTITDVDSMNFGENEDEGRQIALANARLIAAAPELLEALNQLVKAQQRADDLSMFADRYAQESVSFQISDAIKAAKAAIAKATNE